MAPEGNRAVAQEDRLRELCEFGEIKLVQEPARVVILLRFGLFPLVVPLITQEVLFDLVHTTHLGAWHASSTIMGIVFVLALAIYGFKISLGGQPIFQRLGAR